MIAADRLALKANIIQGISQNLQLLVDLYSTNLNSYGVQSSVIASIMYASLASTSLYDEELNEDRAWLSGLYYGSSILSLTAAMSCVILCTIAAVYGPWLSLTGDSNTVIIKGAGRFPMSTYLYSHRRFHCDNSRIRNEEDSTIRFLSRMFRDGDVLYIHNGLHVRTLGFSKASISVPADFTMNISRCCQVRQLPARSGNNGDGHAHFDDFFYRNPRLQGHAAHPLQGEKIFR